MCLFGADGLDGRSKGVLCVCCCDGGAVHRNPMGTRSIPIVGSEVSSSLGGAKNYHYQRYFVPYKICIISFNSETTMFLWQQ